MVASTASVTSQDTTSPVAHQSEVGHADAHASGGLPQLEMQHWAGQIIWLLLIFAVLYILLSKVFLPRLRRVRDERAGAISSAVKAALEVQANANAQAEIAQAELAKARSEVRANALASKARITEDANARQVAEEAVVNARIAQAEAEIRQARDAAMTNVSTIAIDTTRSIVERLTGQTATVADATAAVKGAA